MLYSLTKKLAFAVCIGTLLPGSIPGQQPLNLAKVVQPAQTPEQQIKDAITSLQNNLQQLQQLKAKSPSTAGIDQAIAQVQSLLNTVTQSYAQIQMHKLTTAQLQAAATSAQANAQQGSAIATETMIGSSPTRGVRVEHHHKTTAAPIAEAAKVTAAPILEAPKATIAPVPPPPPPPAPPVSTPAPVSTPTPAVVTAPASTPAATIAPVPVSTPAPTSDGETAWFNKLKNGMLKYTVPDTMLWKVESTVTVQVQGESTTNSVPLDHQSAQAPIKVARQMKVLVSAPDNPDEFTIAPESDTQLQQYVPEDGTTTWHFSVTPKYTASAQKLVVQAWVIYDTNTQQELPVYSTVVNVHIPGLGECLKRLFEGDPDYWLKYGLPGGAGFIFISGIVTGLWKWFTRKKKTDSDDDKK